MIKGVGDLDWRFDFPISIDYRGNNKIRILGFTLVPNKPIKKGEPASLSYKGGSRITEDPAEIYHGNEYIPEQAREIAKWMSINSRYRSEVMVYTPGKLVNEIGFSWYEPFKWDNDPDFRIERPTKFITALVRKINRHLAKQTR